MLPQPIKVKYLNYRGEVAIRTVLPRKIVFGVTPYHKKPQWLLKCFDLDKQGLRTYALKDCDFMHIPQSVDG